MLALERNAPEDDLRRALVECGRICYDRKLVTSTDGNLSVRVGADHFLITPAGACKGRMQPDDLILIDLQGKRMDHASGGRISSETPMHLEVYRQRADVNAVIHAHPVFATALSVAGIDYPFDILPESVVLLGEVPTTAFALPASAEDADAIRGLIGRHDALVLRQHGTLTCGLHLESALCLLERLEFVAEVFHRARALGQVQTLTPEIRRRLEQTRAEPAAE